jgi:hypothetical protein
MTPEEKKKIEAIAKSLEDSEGPFYEACKLLKSLIEEKWEPKKFDQHWWIGQGGGVHRSVSSGACTSSRLYGNEWETKELAETARDMNKRNQLILQAKHERGYGDGDWTLVYSADEEKWVATYPNYPSNPELTFDTKAHAKEVLKMVIPCLK